MSRPARAVSQTCPNCSLVHDVGVYVSGQRVLCKCGVRFEVRRDDVKKEASRSGGEGAEGASRAPGIHLVTGPGGAQTGPEVEPVATEPDAYAATALPRTSRNTVSRAEEGIIDASAFEPTMTPRPGHSPSLDATGTPLPANEPMGSGAPVQLRGYTLHDLLGRGGMGEVWRATQVSLGRPVAVKLLPPRHASDPEFVARFEKEATALASLNHPHIVQIIDRGVEAEHYYFVMEYVEGRSLRDRIHQRALTWSDSLRIALQVARAIECAHDTQIIHRDLKPENILLDSRGQVKVADFGLAGMHGTGAQFQLTGTAVAMGTLNYMAPEQRRDARNVDGRADIYSLGVMIYEMLTGELPIGRFRMPTERVPGIDPRVDGIISSTLEPDPDQRYPSVRPLCEEIEKILASVSTQPAAAASGPMHAVTAVTDVIARPRSRARKTWSNLRTGLAVVGGLAVLSFLVQWGFGTRFSLHVDGKSGNQMVITHSGVSKGSDGRPTAPVKWPANTNDEIFVSAAVSEEKEGNRSALSIDFDLGEEEINLHEGQWRIEAGQLRVTQAGNETNRAKLVPRAYVAHRYFSTDDFDAEVWMNVKPLGAEFPLDETAQRFGEVAMRINELQVSVFAIPGVGMRLLWKYLTPDGVEMVGNSARDIDNLVEDEAPVPRQGPFKVRLRLQRVKAGAEVTAYVNGTRFARKTLPGLEGQVGKIALGCRNLHCTFEDLQVAGTPVQRPAKRPVLAKD